MKIHALALAITPLVLGSSVSAASFDCTLAGNYSEKQICSNEQLSKFDDQVSALYKAAMALADEPDPLRLQQRAWLKQRSGCADEPCIAALHQSRIAEFRALIGGETAKMRQTSVPEQPAVARQAPVLTSVQAPVAEAPQPVEKPISRRPSIDLASLGMTPSDGHLWGLWSCVASNNGAPSFQRFSPNNRYESWTPDGVSHYQGTFKLSYDGQLLETDYASANSSYSTKSQMTVGMPTNRDLIQKSAYGLTLCDFVDE